MSPLPLTTERLRIRWLGLDDAEFILRLVNDPDWIRFIGDKSVNNLDDARAYLEAGPLASYQRQGFGLNRVALRDSDVPIGICGILQRETLPHPDLGFAFLPRFRRRGYALEAASAVLEHAADELGLSRISAILSRENTNSARLLIKLGFVFERPYRAAPDEAELDLYLTDLTIPW